MEQEVLNTEVPKEESIAVEANVQQDNQQTETPEQINWKKFREAREAERKQKEAAERRALEKEQEAAALKAAMEAILNKPQQPQRGQQPHSYQEVEYEEESEDRRIEKKVADMLAAERRREEEERRQREYREFPQRLASTYSDFNEICSSENLDYLEYHYPEVAEAFKHAPDGFEKWSSVYKAVKRFVPNTNSRKDQSKAEKNFTKPQSMAVPGVTQVGDTAPIKMDDKRRADNWARMQRVMKGG